MQIFEKWKIIVFGQNYGIFWPKGNLKPCIIMYLGNIHNMSLVPVTFGNFFFQILQKWHFLGKIQKSQNGLDIFAQQCSIFSLQKLNLNKSFNLIIILCKCGDRSAWSQPRQQSFKRIPEFSQSLAKRCLLLPAGCCSAGRREEVQIICTELL